MKRSLRDGAFLVAVLGVLLALAPAGCGGRSPDVCFGAKLYLNRTGGMFQPGVNDNAVANVSQIIDTPRELAAWPPLRSYAQLVAHLSLDDDCMDFLNNGADCSETRTFRDIDANCVNSAGQDTECRCGGTTQNTRQALIAATTCG